MEPRRGYADDAEMAECATLGVRVNLDCGRGAMAALLQPVARAAWGRVEDGGDDGRLREECLHALDALRLRVGATAERRFLRSVLAHLDRPAADRSDPARKIGDDRG